MDEAERGRAIANMTPAETLNTLGHHLAEQYPFTYQQVTKLVADPETADVDLEHAMMMDILLHSLVDIYRQALASKRRK